MKKLLSIVAATALLLGLVSCGSTGGAGGGKAAAPAFEHPMTYILDLADSVSPDKITFSDNSQYGDPGKSTRQVVVDFTKLVKINKVQAGDKITVTGTVTSPIDIDSVLVAIVDDSPAASYWTTLSSGETFISLNANEPYEINITFDIEKKMAGNLKFQMAYGEQNGSPTELAVERVGESFIGEANGDIVDPQHKEPKTWEFDISKDAAYVEMKPEYPWINGVQDTMADPLCYQVVLDITKIFPDGDQPIAGDKLHLTWKTRCNTDIASIQVRAVENTAAVGWWKEIDKAYLETNVPTTFAENIVADEVNNFVIDIELADGIVDGISLCINYGLDAADGSCLFTYVRDE